MKIEFQIYKIKSQYDEYRDEIIELLIDNISNIPKMKINNMRTNPNYFSIAMDNVIYADLDCELDDLKFTVNLNKLSFGDNLTLNSTLKFSSSSDFQKTYDIKIKFKALYKQFFKGLYIGIDDFNEEKCKELYSLIYNIENRFRYLINNLLIRKVGVEWFKNYVDEEIQYKVVGFSNWYNNKYTEFRDIQTDLFNLQTDDLIKVINNCNTLGIPKEKYTQYCDLKKWLKRKIDFDIPLLEVPKSFKNVYFDNLLEQEFFDDWNEFAYVRNMIAHNKPLCIDFINDTYNLVEKLSNHLDRAEVKLKAFTVSDEKKQIEDLYSDYREDFYFEEAGVNRTPSEEDVIESINDSNDGIEFSYILLDRFDEIKNISEDICNSIDYFNAEINEQSDLEDIKYACIASAILIDQVEASTYVNLVNEISNNKKALLLLHTSFKNQVQDIIDEYLEQVIVNNEKIEEGLILRYNTIFKDKIEISLIGGITPIRASQDILQIKLEIIPHIGMNVIETGLIEVNYADYEIHEDGYSLPTYSDDLFININSISDIVLNTYDEIEKLLGEIQMNIENIQI